MIEGFAREQLCGVWSATPTPLCEDLSLDVPSIERMVEHHAKLDIRGLFVAGSCGEGPWLPDEDRRTLVREVAKFAKGKMAMAVQVTDNSAARVIDNMNRAAEDGGDVAVIAQPFFRMNKTDASTLAMYMQAIDASPLPVGIYELGERGPSPIPTSVISEIYQHPKVCMIKDSSGDDERRELCLAAREQRPEILVLDGDEFRCVEYIAAGYDGLLLGGGIFNGAMAWEIIRATQAGDIERANAVQDHMNEIMWAVYGGKEIKCWLAGQKQLLVGMGVFRTNANHLNYELNDECAAGIERVLGEEREMLFPWEG